MAELMAEDSDWRNEASEIEGWLDESDIFVLPEGAIPKEWCRSLFETSALFHLAQRMIDCGMEPEVRPASGHHHERSAE